MCKITGIQLCALVLLLAACVISSNEIAEVAADIGEIAEFPDVGTDMSVNPAYYSFYYYYQHQHYYCGSSYCGYYKTSCCGTTCCYNYQSCCSYYYSYSYGTCYNCYDDDFWDDDDNSNSYCGGYSCGFAASGCCGTSCCGYGYDCCGYYSYGYEYCTTCYDDDFWNDDDDFGAIDDDYYGYWYCGGSWCYYQGGYTKPNGCCGTECCYGDEYYCNGYGTCESIDYFVVDDDKVKTAVGALIGGIVGGVVGGILLLSLFIWWMIRMCRVSSTSRVIVASTPSAIAVTPAADMKKVVSTAGAYSQVGQAPAQIQMQNMQPGMQMPMGGGMMYGTPGAGGQIVYGGTGYAGIPQPIGQPPGMQMVYTGVPQGMMVPTMATAQPL